LRQRLSFGNVNRDPAPDPDDISEMRQTLRDEVRLTYRSLRCLASRPHSQSRI
ncbi:hypothetical protein E4U11_003975, partial [Claviceps purpurea]